MKACLVVLLTAGIAAPLHADPVEPGQPSAKTQLSIRSDYSFLEVQEPPNEIHGRRLTYSGVIPQAIKTRQPLQLINPAAPAQYWSEHGNADRDVVTGKINGFKLLSFSF